MKQGYASFFENFMKSLQVMWQAMLGIFVVMIVLYISIVILAKISERSEKKRLAEKEDTSSGR